MARRPLKVIVVGDSNVGKTSLIVRFVQNTFDTARFPTIGETLYHRSINLPDGRTIHMNVIDTTGVEDYGGITSVALRSADIVLFVASYDDRTSISSVSDKWLPQVDAILSPEDHLRFLAVNKSDIPVQDRKFKDETGQELANDIGATEFFIVSAKTGNGIDDMFTKLANHAAQNVPASHEMPMPVAIDPGEKEESKKCC